MFDCKFNLTYILPNVECSFQNIEYIPKVLNLQNLKEKKQIHETF
jgi:hypothetical protein